VNIQESSPRIIARTMLIPIYATWCFFSIGQPSSVGNTYGRYRFQLFPVPTWCDLSATILAAVPALAAVTAREAAARMVASDPACRALGAGFQVLLVWQKWESAISLV
jgi:hypothetical protein